MKGAVMVMVMIMKSDSTTSTSDCDLDCVNFLPDVKHLTVDSITLFKPVPSTNPVPSFEADPIIRPFPFSPMHDPFSINVLDAVTKRKPMFFHHICRNQLAS